MAKWYYVISRSRLKDLIYEVNKYIDKGFEPLGGICDNGVDGYQQAMVKEYDPNNSTAVAEYDSYLDSL